MANKKVIFAPTTELLAKELAKYPNEPRQGRVDPSLTAVKVLDVSNMDIEPGAHGSGSFNEFNKRFQAGSTAQPSMSGITPMAENPDIEIAKLQTPEYYKTTPTPTVAPTPTPTYTPPVSTYAPPTMANYPKISLQPSQTYKKEVEQLQQYLVSQGYMTQAEMAGGPGFYGPKTKSAVAKLQSKLGVDTAGYAGYWGPKTLAALATPAAPAPTPAVAPVVPPVTPPVAPSGVVDTGDPILNKVLETLTKLLSQADAQGKKINPNVDLATLSKAALAEAIASVDPYYAGQIKSVREDLEQGITSLAKGYELAKEERAAQYKQSLGIQQESEAGKGTIFSGERIQREQALGAGAARSFESLAGRTTEAARGMGTRAERSIGSLGLTGYQTPTIGQYGISPTSQLTSTSRTLWSPAGGLTGSSEYEQRAAIEKRQSWLESAERKRQEETQRKLFYQ